MKRGDEVAGGDDANLTIRDHEFIPARIVPKHHHAVRNHPVKVQVDPESAPRRQCDRIPLSHENIRLRPIGVEEDALLAPVGGFGDREGPPSDDAPSA